MDKDALIVKQQLEIEDLKIKIDRYREACRNARGYLNRPEQWSLKCPDFPKVAIHGICSARDELSFND